MIRKLCCLLFIVLIGVWSIDCKKPKKHEEEKHQKISQVLTEKQQDRQRRLGQHKGTLEAPGEESPRGRMRKGWDKGSIVELSEEEGEFVKIQTIKAARKPLRSQLQALGKVLAHPKKKAIVSYAFPARISIIHIQIGDWVKKGQTLITLQSEEVGKAKSEFYKAQADYELARVNFERQKRLYDRGVGAQKEFFASEAEFKVAEANLNAAEKKLHILGFTEEQVTSITETHQINPVITLFSPINGKIIENKAILGAMIDQSTEILTIMDPRVLCINAEIYEKDIAEVRTGQDVEVTVPAYPGELFRGKITYISDILKEETRTITVRTEVENKEYKLKPGMFAEIVISLNHQSRALVIPQEAVLDDKGEKIVFIKQEGKYFPRRVETGIKENGLIEIIRGLQEGEEVVIQGNYQLKSKLYDEILKKAGVH